jgi:hypothetical protein
MVSCLELLSSRSLFRALPCNRLSDVSRSYRNLNTQMSSELANRRHTGSFENGGTDKSVVLVGPVTHLFRLDCKGGHLESSQYPERRAIRSLDVSYVAFLTQKTEPDRGEDDYGFRPRTVIACLLASIRVTHSTHRFVYACHLVRRTFFNCLEHSPYERAFRRAIAGIRAMGGMNSSSST